MYLVRYPVAFHQQDYIYFHIIFVLSIALQFVLQLHLSQLEDEPFGNFTEILTNPSSVAGKNSVPTFVKPKLLNTSIISVNNRTTERCFNAHLTIFQSYLIFLNGVFLLLHFSSVSLAYGLPSWVQPSMQRREMQIN